MNDDMKPNSYAMLKFSVNLILRTSLIKFVIKMNSEKVKFLLAAFVLRLFVVYIAKIIDENSTTNKFTDTDYEVFSDAATHVYNGATPFARHTYRYTPLAAYICIVNNIFHPLAGKIIFCLCDILLGFIYWEIVDHQRN